MVGLRVLDYVLPPEPLNKIQSNYVYLLNEMDVSSGLLDRLFNDGVLKVDERTEIDVLKLPRKLCEKLLSVLRRKTLKQYEIFLGALEATHQKHVADVLRLEGSFSIFVMKNNYGSRTPVIYKLFRFTHRA